MHTRVSIDSALSARESTLSTCTFFFGCCCVRRAGARLKLRGTTALPSSSSAPSSTRALVAQFGIDAEKANDFKSRTVVRAVGFLDTLGIRVAGTLR
jgi:hypothetical protein